MVPYHKYSKKTTNHMIFFLYEMAIIRTNKKDKRLLTCVFYFKANKTTYTPYYIYTYAYKV